MKGEQMKILIKRVYDTPVASDGYRVLVDGLWPRGVIKKKARIDLWLREVAPSSRLRQWYNHDPDKWAEFKKRYFAELNRKRELLKPIKQRARTGRVTFVFATRETRYNNAAALREYLQRSRHSDF